MFLVDLMVRFSSNSDLFDKVLGPYFNDLSVGLKCWCTQSVSESTFASLKAGKRLAFSTNSQNSSK